MAKLPPSLRATAIGEALRAAAEEERGVLAAALIEAGLERDSGGEAALLEIVRSWDRLPGEARHAAMAAGGERWTALCQRLLDDSDRAMRKRAVSLVGELGLVELAERVADSLLAGEEAAEGALIELARSAVWPGGESGPRPASVDAAIARAAAAYPDHRRRGALIALAELLSASCARRGAAGRVVRDGSGPVAMALRGIIRKDENPRFAGFAFVWLTEPALEAACRDRVSRMGGEEIAHVAQRAHLLAHPARLAKLRHALAAWSMDAACGSAEAHPAIRAGVLRLASAMPETAGSRLVGGMIADPSEGVRLGAVRAAAAWEGEAGAACLADLCFDAEEPVARAAAAALLSRSQMRETNAARRALPHLERSAHATVRDMAARLGAAMRLGSGAAAGGRLRARRAMEEDRAVFLDRLRLRIKSGTAGQRVAAIQLAMRLRVCREVELELLSALSGVAGRGEQAGSAEVDQTAEPLSPAHVVATAVRALGFVRSAASAAAVRACLSHPDARVRANAVEVAGAAGQRDQVGGDEQGLRRVLERYLQDAHHRVRAAAVRAAMQSAVGLDGVVRDAELAAGAGSAISGMLAADDVMMRLSGLWAMGRVASRSPEIASALAARVEDLSRTDAEEVVRVRAGALSERLLRGMRAGWAARAWAGGEDCDDAPQTVQADMSEEDGEGAMSRREDVNGMSVVVRSAELLRVMP